jgi:hypothetical protein
MSTANVVKGYEVKAVMYYYNAVEGEEEFHEEAESVLRSREPTLLCNQVPLPGLQVSGNRCPAPGITSLSPTSGAVGASVTITGSKNWTIAYS